MAPVGGGVTLAFLARLFLSHLWLLVAIAVAEFASVLIVAWPAPRLTGLQAACARAVAVLPAWTVVSHPLGRKPGQHLGESGTHPRLSAWAGMAAVNVVWAGPRGPRCRSLGVLAAIGVGGTLANWEEPFEFRLRKPCDTGGIREDTEPPRVQWRLACLSPASAAGTVSRK